ncbi:MAG TPA: hypothetical protein VF395_11090, partial [Polyangiaceae bacterium]
PAPLAEPLPKEVHVVPAQRLFVEKAGLPSALLNEIKRLAAFQNPEFYKKQKMRLSTAVRPENPVATSDEDLERDPTRGCRYSRRPGAEPERPRRRPRHGVSSPGRRAEHVGLFPGAQAARRS